MLSRLLITSGACLIGANVCVSAQPVERKCDWAAFERSAAEMRAAREKAMKVPTKDLYTDIPPEVIGYIQAFKNGLDEAHQQFFGCQSSEPFEPVALENALYQKLGLPHPKPPDTKANEPGNEPLIGLFLANVEIKVQIVPDARRLVAVQTTFGIPYGEDAALDIFALDKNGKWSQVIHFTSNPYVSIYGAFAAFDYKVSPPDKKGDWFVVATHINPWPSSCWQTLFTDVVRPQDLGFQPQFFHDEQWGYICDEVPPYLRKVGPDSFEVRFSIPSMDEGQLSSVSLKTYRITGDEVTRIQPVALNPVNFVDEWLRNKWRDARDWSAPENLPRLQQQHSQVRHSMSGDFVSDRKCTVNSRAEVGFVEVGESGNEGPTWYFLVRKRRNNYTMLRVSHYPSPSCKGLDRLATVKDR